MSTFAWVAVAILTIGSAARITRLITFDVYPPSVWLRTKWQNLTNDNSWTPLLTCPYCFAPYAAAGVLLWGYLSDFHEPWWWANGWLTAAYLAAILVRFDGDDD
jgi:hypothetical protein